MGEGREVGMEEEGVGGREEVEGEGGGEKGGSRRSKEVGEREGLYGDRGEHWRVGEGMEGNTGGVWEEGRE